MIMYVKPGCPYCDQARAGLAAKGVEWEERDATANPAWKRELMDHSRGSGMVPTMVAPDGGITVGWEGKG